MNMTAILVMWLWPFEGTFNAPTQRGPHKIWLQLALWLLRRRSLKMVKDNGRRTMDNGQRMPTHTISSPMGLRSGELKIKDFSGFRGQANTLHGCTIGTFISDHRRCGLQSPRHYDPETHDCKNGKIITRQIICPSGKKKLYLLTF